MAEASTNPCTRPYFYAPSGNTPVQPFITLPKAFAHEREKLRAYTFTSPPRPSSSTLKPLSIVCLRRSASPSLLLLLLLFPSSIHPSRRVSRKAIRLRRSSSSPLLPFIPTYPYVSRHQKNLHVTCNVNEQLKTAPLQTERNLVL